MSFEKHLRLAHHAQILKKAWLCAAAMLGVGSQISMIDRLVPAYREWENKTLKIHIKELEDDFGHLAKRLLLHWDRKQLLPAASWFAKNFDGWSSGHFQFYEMGRVADVEAVIGPLGHRAVMDCPPYAQVILQGWEGAAIRHPEYHLGTDLALLYNLFLDSQAFMEEATLKNQVHSSENNQSLGRSVILTCFNLLEAFVSGLASAWILENPGGPATTIAKMKNDGDSLRRRFVEFPAIIAGKSGLIDGKAAPVAPLFDECKPRRDSYVHCQPGPHPNKRGYVKEVYFHDVDLQVVQKTVDLTHEAICLVWRALQRGSKPSWLPEREANGRFPRVDVGLVRLDDGPILTNTIRK